MATQDVRFTALRGANRKEKGGSPEDARPKVPSMNNIAPIVGETTLIRRDPTKTIKAGPAIEYAGIIEMTPEEWAAVNDNPRQRDTEAHARRAKHLMVPHPSHCKVNMARIISTGTEYKLDGHTRGLLWAMGKVPAPSTLYVDVWLCRTIGDVVSLYGTFDSKSAVETPADQVFGAKREKNTAFSSQFLKGGKFAASMRFAYECMFDKTVSREKSIYDLLGYWMRELELLDQCKPGTHRFHVGVAASALLTFRRYGVDAIEFWTAFADGAGTKADGLMDAVQALEERMDAMRRDHRLGGRANMMDIVGVCISAFERHRDGERYVTGGTRGAGIKKTTGNSFREWMISAKNIKRKVV